VGERGRGREREREGEDRDGGRRRLTLHGPRKKSARFFFALENEEVKKWSPFRSTPSRNSLSLTHTLSFLSLLCSSLLTPTSSSSLSLYLSITSLSLPLSVFPPFCLRFSLSQNVCTPMYSSHSLFHSLASLFSVSLILSIPHTHAQSECPIRFKRLFCSSRGV
jgi:hypothetical protein